MNKKNVVTKTNIEKLSDFLQRVVNELTTKDHGCRTFPLDRNLSVYVGWSAGFDMADSDLIKSPKGRVNQVGWVSGYALCVAVKIRKDHDFLDFDKLGYPHYEDGECCDRSKSIRPNMGKRDYNACAKSLLEDFVYITNMHIKGELRY